jgi:hypothetical protein
MADRIFLRLGCRAALGADDLQWILYTSKFADTPDLSPRFWRAVSYVRSSKMVLERCIRDKGLEFTAAGSEALARLNCTFDAWKVAQNPSSAPAIGHSRESMDAL